MTRPKISSPTKDSRTRATRRAPDGARPATEGSDGAKPADLLDGLRAESPARDEAGLLAQSPRLLFFFWSFARDPRETLRRALGAPGEGLQLAVRLVDLEGDAVVTYAAAPSSQSIWFEARPRREYRAEVGFFAPGAPFVRVLSSNVVETAPEAPSQVSDEAAEFRVSPPDFARILAASGFAESAAEFARAATAGEAGNGVAPDLSPRARRAPSSLALGATREETDHAPPPERRAAAVETFDPRRVAPPL
jgi:hypothetical protein